MARIKFSSLISDVAGSVGSATFQRSAYGPTLRNKPIQKRSSTASQQMIKQYMNCIQYSWHDLSDADKEYWNAYVSYSNSKSKHNASSPLSGYALFVKYNMYLQLLGQAIVTAPSYELLPEYNPALVASWIDASTFQLYFAGTSLFVNQYPIIKLSQPVRPGTAFNKSLLKFVSLVYVEEGLYDPSVRYTELFGLTPAASSILEYSLIFIHARAAIFSPVTHGFIEVLAP